MIGNISQLIEHLRKLPMVSPKYCDNCGAMHADDDVRYMGQHQNSFAFQVTCKQCGVSYLMRVGASMSGVAAQKLELSSSDVGAEELKKFVGRSKVQKDEVLQVYSDLRRVRTLEDFLKLFNKHSNNPDF